MFYKLYLSLEHAAVQALRPLFNPVKYARPFLEKLQQVTHTEVVTSKSRAEFFQDLQHKYKDIFAIYRTSSSGAVAGKFDAEFMNQLPPSCKYICHNGPGYDHIDTTACFKRGIIVTNAPDPVADATADLALFLLLGALRQLNPALPLSAQGHSNQALTSGMIPKVRFWAFLAWDAYSGDAGEDGDLGNGECAEGDC